MSQVGVKGAVEEVIAVLERYFQMMASSNYEAGDPFSKIDDNLVRKVVEVIDIEFEDEIRKNEVHWHNRKLYEVPSFASMPFESQRAMVKELHEIMDRYPGDMWKSSIPYHNPYAAWYGAVPDTDEYTEV